MSLEVNMPLQDDLFEIMKVRFNNLHSLEDISAFITEKEPIFRDLLAKKYEIFPPLLQESLPASHQVSADGAVIAFTMAYCFYKMHDNKISKEVLSYVFVAADVCIYDYVIFQNDSLKHDVDHFICDLYENFYSNRQAESFDKKRIPYYVSIYYAQSDISFITPKKIIHLNDFKKLLSIYQDDAVMIARLFDLCGVRKALDVMFDSPLYVRQACIGEWLLESSCCVRKALVDRGFIEEETDEEYIGRLIEKDAVDIFKCLLDECYSYMSGLDVALLQAILRVLKVSENSSYEVGLLQDLLLPHGVLSHFWQGELRPIIEEEGLQEKAFRQERCESTQSI